MSKLAKLQEEKLEQLKMLSSAGRAQLEEALAPETAPKSPAPREIVSAEEPEAPAATETPEALAQKQVRRSVVRGKRLGRPPFAAEMRASTVYLPESVYAQLEALANKSGKKGFKRPGLSETVRAALRLVQSRQWSSEEINQAFAEDVGVGGVISQ
jgi:Arc/MetJ-type ribon-helix-helix transcriptional regulator